MIKVFGLGQSDERKLTFTFIRNISSGLPSPSYQIRLNPLKDFLMKKDHNVLEVNLQDFLRDPHFSDVLIFQRYLQEDFREKTGFLSNAFMVLRENSNMLVWDVDDDLIELQRMQSGEEELNSIAELFLREVDIFTVSTKNLMKRLACEEKGLLLPNQPLRKFRKVRFHSSKELIEIGYLGNFDRHMDIFLVLSFFSQYCEDKVIVLHTYALPPELEARLAISFRNVKIVNYSPMSYLRVLDHYSKLRLHCSIAPLSDSLFNESKSAIKFIDYSVNRAPVLMSNVGEISELLSDNVLLPPLGSIEAEAIWVKELGDVFKRSSSLLKKQNSARLEFKKVRNTKNQQKIFSELLFKIQDRVK